MKFFANVTLDENQSSETQVCLNQGHDNLSLQKVPSASKYFGLVIPVLAYLYHGYVHYQRRLVQLLRNHLSPFDFEQLFRATALFESFRPLALIQLIPTHRKSTPTETPAAEGVRCQVLYDPGPSERTADIIFIHGLNGALEKTWAQGLWRLGTLRILDFREEKICEIKSETKDLTSGRSICWPRDWLPHDCPTARVISIDYTTDPYLWRPFFISGTNRSRMAERAWEMLSRLSELGVGCHSIVWVGHSKGGLYVKQMLVNACSLEGTKYDNLRRNTKGIMFYSVPHKGSNCANINIPFIFRQSIEVLEVQKHCESVMTLHTQFLNLLKGKVLDIRIRSFIETRLTLISLFPFRIVSEDSADAEVGELYGVPLDHRNICKPNNRDCFMYQELLKFIQEVCDMETA